MKNPREDLGGFNMSSFKVNTSIPVKDVMSSPVLTVFKDDSIENVAS